MSSISLRIEGEKFSAREVLTAASNFLKLLSAIERDQTGKKRAVVQWKVNIVTTHGMALITLSAEGEPEGLPVVIDTLREAAARMKTPSLT